MDRQKHWSSNQHEKDQHHIKKVSEKSMWEWEFILMYKIHCHFRTTKKTIKTMDASCYTERHSVWYVVNYCKHILTDICYRVERKRSALSSNGNSVMYICNTSCGAKKEQDKGGNFFQNTLNWEIKHCENLFNKIQAPLPCIRWRTMQTRER